MLQIVSNLKKRKIIQFFILKSFQPQIHVPMIRFLKFGNRIYEVPSLT